MIGKKIFNDPVYGFVTVPYGILFDLIEHSYFQRLRRIKQLSLTHYVYPGALHTRFHHALGALHLMQQAIEVLRSKDVEISDEEKEAACIAILLHDIGHAPFSHTLEHTLIDIPHEAISLLFMEALNEEFNGKLSLAIRIFNDDYPKKYLHQLVSSQLDMDRMDYLNRDSFFTGVSEGVIGYDRIIKMLSVAAGELVVEEKGIYSIEKFLVARRLMYWQVYFHKTVVAAEQMLVKTLQRARQLTRAGIQLPTPKYLRVFLERDFKSPLSTADKKILLSRFAKIDDYDITQAVKAFTEVDDKILSYLATCLIDRKLFKVQLKNTPFDAVEIEGIKKFAGEKMGIENSAIKYLVFQGEETNRAYSTAKNEINILFKNGEVWPMSQSMDHGIQSNIVTKYFLCYPRLQS